LVSIAVGNIETLVDPPAETSLPGEYRVPEAGKICEKGELQENGVACTAFNHRGIFVHGADLCQKGRIGCKKNIAGAKKRFQINKHLKTVIIL
jgi:hypothetical protein